MSRCRHQHSAQLCQARKLITLGSRAGAGAGHDRVRSCDLHSMMVCCRYCGLQGVVTGVLTEASWMSISVPSRPLSTHSSSASVSQGAFRVWAVESSPVATIAPICPSVSEDGCCLLRHGSMWNRSYHIAETAMPEGADVTHTRVMSRGWDHAGAVTHPRAPTPALGQT